MTTPRSSKVRWHWAAHAAAAATSIPVAHAGTVQITLGNTVVSDGANITANSLGPVAPSAPGGLDLTGDGNNDLEGIQVLFDSSTNPVSTYYRLRLMVSATIASTFTAAASSIFGSASWVYTNFSNASIHIAEVRPATTTTGNTEDRTGLIPIRFADPRINGGAETGGFLEVNSLSPSPEEKQITLVRLIFDDSDTTQPADAQIGMPVSEWVDPAVTAAKAAQRAKLQREIKKRQRALRRAQKANDKKMVRKLKKVVRKLRRQLNAL